MNKFLALLFFAFLISYSICEGCSCSQDIPNGGNAEHYSCVQLEENTCEWRLKCTFAVKPTTNDDENEETTTEFHCSDYPASVFDKTCVENTDEVAVGETKTDCKEVYISCKEVPAPTGEETATCSSYPVSDSKYICQKVEGLDHPCEEYTCGTVPKPLDASKKCEDYPTANGETHYCSDAPQNNEEETEELACIEVRYCEGNVRGQCDKYKVSPDNVETHVCVDGETNCEEKYKCDKVPSGSEKNCNDMEITINSKETHKCIERVDGDDDFDTLKCKEVKYSCNDVPKINGETDIQCSTFDPANKETHKCVERVNGDTDADKFQCKEVKLCSQVTNSDMTPNTNCENDFWYDKNTKICKKNTETNICEELEKETPTPTPTESCNTIPNDDDRECINIQPSDANHICVDNTGGSTKCIEKLLCSKVPKPADNTDSVDCSSTNYQVSEEHKNTHICIQDLESQNYACKEEYLCSQATGTNNEECSKFPVNPTNILTHGCIKDTGNQNKCKEESLCTRVTLASATDELCNNYPVDINKLNTHICIKSDDTTCKEESLCENVGKGANIICSNYPVKKENKATHGCIESRNPEKACQEEKFCASVTDGTSDEQCRRYPVSYENMDKKVCIKNQNDNTMGCIEKELCTTITKGDGIDCSKYPVSNDKMKTHLCKDVEGNEKCSEVEIDCSTAEKGETDEQCSYYKVSDPNKNCVKNTDTSEGAKPCKEVSKNECELKTSGATDDNSCKDLAVDKADEQICRKNPEGDNCVQLTYCEYGIGLDDYDCAKYTLKDSEKICKKKASENKCEEVTKTDDEQPGSGDDNGNGGKNGNSGSFLNVAFGLLFIISLV